VTLVDEGWQVPAAYAFGAGETLIPLRAGERLPWRLLG
jgi:dihydroorotase